ncbi:hypothetical protein BLS_005911 [Venturia inaequalis]|uniref:Uncharacterized protein n=1 Tax=Venturia inaequalis TaxID=5025 RepID=A0A8H3UG19_VENIN|nr:hypothetical protein EG328_009238 [Venturia inaequalis]KAE9968317.1 hypothetical protein BLS_005911 [Venturia inaequalis]KAE9968842.1 hypothetical protein EG327_010889 [Venturia inaequalis]RDI85523.1 hypothetical protein Vi05172_g4346 [Venturia inaequalis]
MSKISSSLDRQLATGSASQTSIIATSKASITTTAPTTSSATNTHMRTVFITITTSASPRYTMNATEKIRDQKSAAIGSGSAVGVMVFYVLFAFCLYVGWFVRYVRRKAKIRPGSLPPVVAQQGDGGFLATHKKRREKSGTSMSTVTAIETSNTSRYSFDEYPENDWSEKTAMRESSLYTTHKSVCSLVFEAQPYLTSLSTSPTISGLPSLQRGSASSYGGGNHVYSSVQTVLTPLACHLPSQSQQHLDEAEFAKPARPGPGGEFRRGTWTLSERTLRYCIGQSEDDDCDPEPEPESPIPPMPTRPVAAMLRGRNGNPYLVPYPVLV